MKFIEIWTLVPKNNQSKKVVISETCLNKLQKKFFTGIWTLVLSSSKKWNRQNRLKNAKIINEKKNVWRNVLQIVANSSLNDCF